MPPLTLAGAWSRSRADRRGGCCRFCVRRCSARQAAMFRARISPPRDGRGATGQRPGTSTPRTGPRPGCLESRVDLTRPTGTVLLIVDRSSAMNTLNDSTCAACGTYSTTLARTVETLTTATSNRFRWGLELFPSAGRHEGVPHHAGPGHSAHDRPSRRPCRGLACRAARRGGPRRRGGPSRRRATWAVSAAKSPSSWLLATAGTPTCAANDPAQDDLSAAVSRGGRGSSVHVRASARTRAAARQARRRRWTVRLIRSTSPHPCFDDVEIFAR